MNKINPFSFKSLNYTNIPLYSHEVTPDTVEKLKSSKFLIDNPSDSIKDIIENSDFFKNLDESTDVFVSSNIIERNDTPAKNFLGTIIAVFKDPDDESKKTADEVHIITDGCNPENVLRKLKKIVQNLPDYSQIKENSSNQSIIILDNFNGFVYSGQK